MKKCPKCGNPLVVLLHKLYGDYVCEVCPPNYRGNFLYCYWWEHEVTSEPEAIIPITWERLVKEDLEFANAQFPTATNASKSEHLRREAIELAKEPTDIEEMGDVLLLLIHLAGGQSVDLVDVAYKKLQKNKARTWGVPDAQGVVEHIKEEELENV